MSLEVRFTLKNLGREIPFTIVDDSDVLFLYSSIDDKEYKYQLKNNNGLLRLEIDNPFEETIEIVEERLTGLSADWIELRSQGLENSTDFIISKQPGYGPDDIFVENKPFSLKQIVDLIDSKDIELTPDFQRNFIWDKTRQSRLIESIFLGLPLPSIYLSQYEDGRLTVVDGLQRLSTIKEFFDDSLVLSNLEYLQDCNGLRYSQLSNILSPLRIRRFGQTQIMCFVIDYRSPSKLKFDLFRRLNTGGKPLNNQEIRNCLSKPEVQLVLKKMVSLESFGNATDWSVKDTRMDAREAALRFIYFSEQSSQDNPIGKYNGDMESTLDEFTDILNTRSSKEIEKYVEIYDNALKNAYHLFGKYCFRKVLTDTVGHRRTAVNKLLMLSLSIILSKYEYKMIEDKFQYEELIVSLAELISTAEETVEDKQGRLFDAITWGTNGRWNIHLALKSFDKFFENKIQGANG